MKKTFSVRALGLADFDAVLRLWQESEGVGLNESDSRENIALFLKRNPGLSRVAVHDGQIIGAVLCGHDGRRGYLHHLAVEKARRRQGVGRQLVEACLDDLTRLGIAKCNIFLFADNAAGEAFWQHNGWNARRDLVVVQKNLMPEAKKYGCSC
ncbi:MAG TPA: GNAT family N-acetyltransferase [Verrucomicrobiae bacterium]